MAPMPGSGIGIDIDTARASLMIMTPENMVVAERDQFSHWRRARAVGIECCPPLSRVNAANLPCMKLSCFS
jgi:hypothetical protein